VNGGDNYKLDDCSYKIWPYAGNSRECGITLSTMLVKILEFLHLDGVK
jgi:hypothetical protein